MKCSHVVLAFLGGAVVGGALGILFAPQSGKETREDIRDFVEDEIGQAKKFVNKNVTKAKKAVARGRRVVEKEIAGAKTAVRHEIDALTR